MTALIWVLCTPCGKALGQMQDTVRLTLDDAIAIAQEQSVNAAMAKNKQKTAYWQYRTFRAEQLPEITFTGDLPDYRRNFTPYQLEDGSYTFVRNNNIGMNGGLSLTQNIPFTGRVRGLGENIILQGNRIPVFGIALLLKAEFYDVRLADTF